MDNPCRRAVVALAALIATPAVAASGKKMHRHYQSYNQAAPWEAETIDGLMAKAKTALMIMRLTAYRHQRHLPQHGELYLIRWRSHGLEVVQALSRRGRGATPNGVTWWTRSVHSIDRRGLIEIPGSRYVDGPR